MLWLDGQLGPDVEKQAFLTLTEGIPELKMRQQTGSLLMDSLPIPARNGHDGSARGEQ
jgi:hypothetical protein